VPGIDRRLAEAARLGFRHALIPTYDGPVPDGMSVTTVTDIHDALAVALAEVSRR
jgi:DNA repair protein RadA/Sms